jgi:hypothetical protein
LGAGSLLASAFEAEREASLDLKTFLKKGMLGVRGSQHAAAAGSKVPVRAQARRRGARKVSVERAGAGTRKGYAQAGQHRRWRGRARHLAEIQRPPGKC